MVIFTGTVLRMDGVPDLSGDIFDENTGISLPSHEVKVTFDFREGPEFFLGTAKLSFRPGKLRYRMELDDTRLPKHALETLIPCVGGHVQRSGYSIDHASIEYLSLTQFRNADPRIKPLKDQK